jgi:hypothetical protein
VTHTVSKALATSRKNAPVNVPVGPFNAAGRLQRRAVPGSKPELPVAQLSMLVHFPEDPSQ